MICLNTMALKKVKKQAAKVFDNLVMVSSLIVLPHRLTLWNDSIWKKDKKYLGILCVKSESLESLKHPLDGDTRHLIT